MITGCDISKWQYPTDFAKMKAAGIAFVILRGYFDTLKDKYFEAFREGAKAHGILTGMYHFVDYRDEAEAQAKCMADLYNAFPVDMSTWCDFEHYAEFGTLPTRDKCLNWLYRYINTVEGKTGRVCGFYANSNMVTSVLKPLPRWLIERPLWIAHWGTFSAPVIGEWPTWTLWQHTAKGDGTAHGVGSLDLDLDRYNGTLNELRVWCGLEPIIEQPDLSGLTARVEALEQWARAFGK